MDVLDPLKDVLLTELASGPNDRDGRPAAAHKERGPLAPSASVSRFSSNASTSSTCSLNVFKVTPASQTRRGLTIGTPGAGSLILRRAQVGADGVVLSGAGGDGGRTESWQGWCQLAYYIDPLVEIDTKGDRPLGIRRRAGPCRSQGGECVEESVFPGSARR